MLTKRSARTAVFIDWIETSMGGLQCDGKAVN